MARGMLNESGQSLKTFGEVMFRRTAGAGLLGIDIGLVDATVAKRNDIEKWAKEHATKAAVLLSSRPVPGGMSVVLKKDLPEPARGKLESWLLSPSGTMSGIGRVVHRSDPANYRYVAALGNWTPSQLPGATIVTAGEIIALQQKGATVVDVRTTKEFGDKRIRGAISIPYVEKSLKDVAFDVKLDEFAVPDQMDRNRPMIFHCNGPECWKSYKASKLALAKGFKTVYWFRGGIPEWEKSGLSLETSRVAPDQASAPATAAPQATVARSP
jgi:rhodanese-related sulfurtransferase